jgi:hypothetical protein
MNTETSPAKPARLSLACPWLKRLGLAGFLFFLIKGLLWLFVPGVLVYFGLSG